MAGSCEGAAGATVATTAGTGGTRLGLGLGWTIGTAEWVGEGLTAPGEG
ncbi:hypothetical protein Lfu02_22950 [Longispora fulva]|nr:hypothetical protein Lfu02_22950 [Longispora fulva]